MKRFAVTFVIVAGVYLAVFSQQQQQQLATRVLPTLAPPLPAVVQRAVLGFFQQLGAELLFVKCAVFNGSNLPAAVMEKNANSLSSNLDVATSIYPEFIDPYYLCQATLPHISPTYAGIANVILARYTGTGGQQDIIIHFFRGFNYFYYMNEPQRASEVFAELASRDGAPTWFGHFAAILSARGGNLYAGLISLQSMLAVESDEVMKQRYRDEIEVFNQAIGVEKAIQQYFDTYGVYPPELESLVPGFLSVIPTFVDFELHWRDQLLSLDRPSR